MSRNWLPEGMGADVDPRDEYGNRNVTRPIRLRNPGAIKDFGFNWKGLVFDPELENDNSPAGAHCIFSSVEYGFRAMAKNLVNGYFKRGRNTLRKIVDRYAPSSADFNDPNAYAGWVANRLSWDRDTVLDYKDPSTLATLCYAMAEYECGEMDYWSKGQCERGISMALNIIPSEETPPMVGRGRAPQISVPPEDRRTAPGRSRGIIDGPWSGKRFEWSLGGLLLTYLSDALADPAKSDLISKLIDKALIIFGVAAVLFFVTRIIREWKK